MGNFQICASYYPLCYEKLRGKKDFSEHHPGVKINTALDLLEIYMWNPH